MIPVRGGKNKFCLIANFVPYASMAKWQVILMNEYIDIRIEYI